MKRNMLAPLIAICVILLGLSVGSFFFTPDRAFSENENRYLQTTPELTADNVLSGKFMTEVENYTSDQILLRDFWTGARSALQRLEGRQDISGTYLGADGRYFAKVTDDTFNWDNYQKNLAAVETFFAANDGKSCTALIVPSPAGVLRDSLPEDAPYYDEDRAFAMLEEHLGTAFADARQALAGVADPYYHTDHHKTLPYSTIVETGEDGVTYDILYDILIKQNGDIHSDWTGVKMDVDAYRKVVFEPYDLRVLDGVVDF